MLSNEECRDEDLTNGWHIEHREIHAAGLITFETWG